MNEMKNFPWLKSVFQAFSRTFPGEYSNESLKNLHVNLQKELQKAIKYRDQECLQKLFSCLQSLYSHFCWKINGLKNHSCMKISCVKILSSLIRIGIIIHEKNTTPNSINIILAAIKIFPGTFEMLCDALLLLNCLEKHHYEDFGLVLKQFLFNTKFDVKEPSSYFKALLLLRRLKFLSKDSFEKSKVISLAKKMNIPSDCISWLLENGMSNASTLSNKSIVKQFFNRKLPTTFFVQLRKVLQNELYFDHFLPIDSKTDVTEPLDLDGRDIFKIDLGRNECLIENSSNANKVVYFNKEEINSMNKKVVIENDLQQNNTFNQKSLLLPMKGAETVSCLYASNYSETSSFNGFNRKSSKTEICMRNKKSEIIQIPAERFENSVTDKFLENEKGKAESGALKSSLIANADGTHNLCNQTEKKSLSKAALKNEIVSASKSEIYNESCNTKTNLLVKSDKPLNRISMSTNNEIGINEIDSSKTSTLGTNPEICHRYFKSTDLQINVGLSSKVINNLPNNNADLIRTNELTNIFRESTSPISSNFELEKFDDTHSFSNSNAVAKFNCLASSESCLESPVLNENGQCLEICKVYKNENHLCDILTESTNTETVPKYEITEKMKCIVSSHVWEKEALDNYIGNILYKLVDKVANRIDTTENNSFELLKENLLKEDIPPLKYPFKTNSNASYTSSLKKEDYPFSVEKIAKCLSFSDISLNSAKEKEDDIISAPLFNVGAGTFNRYRHLQHIDNISESASKFITNDDETNDFSESDSYREIDSAQSNLFFELKQERQLQQIDNVSDSASNFVTNDDETNKCSESNSCGEFDSAQSNLFFELKQDIICDKSSKELVCVDTYCDSLSESQSFLTKYANVYKQSFDMEEAKIFVNSQPKLLVNLGKRCNIDKDLHDESSFITELSVEDTNIVLHNIKESKEFIEKNENIRNPEGLFSELNANLNITSNEDSNVNLKFQKMYSPSFQSNECHTKEPTLPNTKDSKHVALIESSIQLKPAFESTTLERKKVQSHMNLRKRHPAPVAENQNLKNIEIKKKRTASRVLGSQDFNLNVSFDLGKLTLDSPPKKKPCKTINSLLNSKEEKSFFLSSSQNIEARIEESKSYNLRSGKNLIKPSRLTNLK